MACIRAWVGGSGVAWVMGEGGQPEVDWPRQSLAVVWHYTHSYGLIDLRKAICESRLGYLYPYAWCTWTVLECTYVHRFKIKL